MPLGVGRAALMGGILTTFAFQSSSTNVSGASITLPASIADGDLLVVLEFARASTTTPPSVVTPSGWTAIDNGSNASSNATRYSASYKIGVTADSSSSVTFMDGSLEEAKICLTFRGNRAIASVTIVDKSNAVTSANPSAQVILGDAAATPHVLLAFYSTQGVAVDPRTYTGGTADGEVSVTSDPFLYVKYKDVDRGANNNDITIDMDDEGSNNVLAGFILTVT